MTHILKVAGLAAVSACAVAWWLVAPVLGEVGIGGWRAIGFFGAAAFGGIGALLIGGWLRATLTVATGLLAGTAWSEFWGTDVRIGLVGSLTAATGTYWSSLLVPWLAATAAGAYMTQLLQSRITRRPHLDSAG